MVTLGLSISGFIFGLTISLFNIIDDEFICTHFKISKDKAQTCEFKKTLNLMFSLGGIATCVLASPVIRVFGRRFINMFLLIVNLVLSISQGLTRDATLMQGLRFLNGFVTCFYTIIIPITFKEYILHQFSANLSATFYVAIAFGTCIGLNIKLFRSEWTEETNDLYIKNIFIVMACLEGFRFFLLFFFYSESPRFRSLQIISRNPDIEEKMDHPESVNPLNEALQNGLESLHEEDEDRVTDSFYHPSSQSIESTSESFIRRREHILSTKNSELKKEIRQDAQISRYFDLFYKKEDQENALNFFFNELIKTYHPDFTKGNFLVVSISLAFDRKYRLQFFVACLLNFLNQMTGINCLIFYSNNIFKFLNKENADFYSGLLGRFPIQLISRDRQLRRICNCARHDQQSRTTRASLLGTCNSNDFPVAAPIRANRILGADYYLFALCVHFRVFDFSGGDSLHLPN